MDEDLARIEREWRENPNDAALTERAIVRFQRAGSPLPWGLIAADPAWAPLVAFIADWYSRPLRPEDGHSPQAIRSIERRLGSRFPRRLREWYRLAAKHPGLPGHEANPWANSKLRALGMLAFDDDGWVCLGIRQYGLGLWGLQVLPDGSLDPTVRLYESEYRRADPSPVGSITEFFSAVLVDEAASGGVADLRDGVRQTTFWRLEPELARTHYAPLSVAPLGANEHDASAEVLGDAETLVRVLTEPPVHVVTRSEAAWERARELFGDPGDPSDVQLEAE